VKAGATLCNWSRKTFKCTLAPPPSDPIFYILVALLTIVMSIPIIMLLQYVLDEYASKNPRKMKREINEVIPPEPSESPAASPQTTSTAPQSDFGKLIIRGAVGENTAVSTTDTALLVYTGNICLSVLSVRLYFVVPMCAAAGSIPHSSLSLTSPHYPLSLSLSRSLSFQIDRTLDLCRGGLYSAQQSAHLLADS
jgi:hypothetical protein